MTTVVVVGGGLLGLAAAYHLTRAGADTLLLDRADAGRATDAGAGILSPETNTRDPESWFDLASAAVATYPQLTAQLAELDAGDTGYARCGLLQVAATEDEVPLYEAARARIFERQRRRGAPSPQDLREVTPVEARRLFPPLTEVYGAIYNHNAARVDGRLLAGALRRAGERLGLTVRHASVERLDMQGGRVTGVVVDAERLRADAVVIAGGAWSPVFGAQLGLDLPIAPQRGQIVHLKLHDVSTSAWAIVSAFHGHYIVPWADGRVVVGATRETGSGFVPRTTLKGLHEVYGEALRVAPGLGEGEVVEARVGLRPYSADGLPILGPVPGVAGLYLCTGHGPTGLTLGPFSARLVAQMTLGETPSLDVSAFSVARFQ